MKNNAVLQLPPLSSDNLLIMDMITDKSKRNDMDNIDYINLPRCLTIHMWYVTETVDSIDCEQSLIFLYKVTARETQARKRETRAHLVLIPYCNL